MTRPVAYRGGKLTVAYAVCADGSAPGRDFVRELPPPDRAKIERLFRLFAEGGLSFNDEKFKKLAGDLFEFKSFQIRLPCYFDSGELVVTHGFRKKRDTTPKQEIERATRIRREDLSRPG